MSTATPFSLPRLCTDFFSPLSRTPQDPHVGPGKDFFDHIAAHFTTVNGVWDGFRIVEYVAALPEYFLSLTPARQDFFNQITHVMNRAGIALSVPKIITNIHNLRHSVCQIQQANSISYSHPERSKVIAHAKKGFIINFMNLGNDTAQAAMFLHEVSILKMGKYYPVADGIYNVTSIVNDTIELIDECFKLHHYNSLPALTDGETNTIQEKRTLSWMKIAKDLPSIIGSVIAFAAIFFAALQVPAVAALSLGLSVAWLTMKLTSVFYEKIILEKQAIRLLSP